MQNGKEKHMPSIADTVLGDAQQLASLHDMLQLKSHAYAQKNGAMTDRLAQCAKQLAAASDMIIEDVVRELSKRHFPFGSRVNPRIPKGNPAEVLGKAIQAFPVGETPATDLTLMQMPERLNALREKVSRYLDNRDTDMAILMTQQKQVLKYLIAAAWPED
jgi:hypothetical protein